MRNFQMNRAENPHSTKKKKNQKAHVKIKDPHLQADSVTNSAWPTIAITPLFGKSGEKVCEVHVPDLPVYVYGISNWMQNLVHRHECRVNQLEGRRQRKGQPLFSKLIWKTQFIIYTIPQPKDLLFGLELKSDIN